MVTDDPGSGRNTANNDGSGVPDDRIPAIQAPVCPMGIPDWLYYAASMGSYGILLPAMALFLPKSPVFHTLG